MSDPESAGAFSESSLKLNLGKACLARRNASSTKGILGALGVGIAGLKNIDAPGALVSCLIMRVLCVVSSNKA